MKRCAVLTALSFILLTSAFAQQDTVLVEYSEESAEASDFSLKEEYKYFTRATVEEKAMFKVGLSHLGYGGYYGLMMEHVIAFEKKINVPFSVLVQYRNEISGWRNTKVGLDAGIRYYYSLPGRIKKGKSANNFSANYFSLQSNNSWGQGYEFDGKSYVPQGTSFNSTVSLLYGIQRRLGKRGYLDFNLGGSYDPGMVLKGSGSRPIYIDGNFSIGVAF